MISNPNSDRNSRKIQSKFRSPLIFYNFFLIEIFEEFQKNSTNSLSVIRACIALLNFRKLKNKIAFWTVSHCQTNNFREKYVELLRQYIDVDIFGKCSGVECPRKGPDGCFTKFVVIIFNLQKKWLFNIG